MRKIGAALNRVTVRHGGGTPTDSNAKQERQPMSIYRSIYTRHFGPIPKGYHIHHIDGNHENNDPNNLACVTAQEHFDAHWKMGDYGSCWALHVTGHVDLTPEERSDLVSKQQKALVEKGAHPWLRRADGSSQSGDIAEERAKSVSKKNRELVENGEHHFLKKNRDPEMEKKRSETLIDKYKDPEFAEFMRQRSIGRTWTLDPETAKKVASFITPFTSETADVCKGTIWINDGIKNKRIKKDETIPEGYTKGRLFTPWNKGKKNG